MLTDREGGAYAEQWSSVAGVILGGGGVRERGKLQENFLRNNLRW